MENFTLIMGLVTSVLLLLGSLLGTALSLVKSVQSKKLALNKVNVTEFLFGAVMEAESLTGLNGDERKKAVLEKYEKYATDHGIAVDLESVSKGIDDIISYSKQLSKPNGK